MTPAQQAEARSRAYALFAGLWTEGMTPSRLAVLARTPLASQLPQPIDLDRIAAAHHSAWTLEVTPYAGVFLDTDTDIGGAAQRLLGDCHAAGFFPKTTSTRADHLGIALAALSFLCGAEADALQDGKAETASRLQQLQQTFLSRHVLSWMPPFFAAGQQVTQGVWLAVLSQTVTVLEDHGAGHEHGRTSLPTSPVDLLDDPKTSLWRIAGVLASPAHSGVYLTRTELQHIGQRTGVPRGFGARQQVLANLLRNAAEYGSLPSLMEALDALWALRCAAYQKLQPTQPHAADWLHQARATRTLFTRLNDAAAQLLSPET